MSHKLAQPAELSDEEALGVLRGELSDDEALEILRGSVPEPPSNLGAFAGGALDLLSSGAGALRLAGERFFQGAQPPQGDDLLSRMGGFGPAVSDPGLLEEGLRGLSQEVYPEVQRGRGGLGEQLSAGAGTVLAGGLTAALAPQAAPVLFGAGEGLPLYYEIKAKTGDEEAANWALLFGNLLGQLEQFGAERYAGDIVKKFAKGKLGQALERSVVEHTLVGGSKEAGTGVAQQGLGDLMREAFTGEDLDNWQNIKDVVPAEFLLGSGFAMADAALSRPPTTVQAPQEAPGAAQPALAAPAPQEAPASPTGAPIAPGVPTDVAPPATPVQGKTIEQVSQEGVKGVRPERRKIDLKPEDIEVEQQLKGFSEAMGEAIAQKRAAETDALTGLFNLRGDARWSRRLVDFARAQKKRAFRIFIDLRDLTGLNQLFDHPFANQIIKDFVAEWRGLSREGDVRGSRTGGDEFGSTVVPTGMGAEGFDPQQIVDRIEDAAQRTLRRHGLEGSIQGRIFGADAGWAEITDEGTPEEALARAEKQAEEMAKARKVARNPTKVKLSNEQFAAMAPAARAQREANLKAQAEAELAARAEAVPGGAFGETTPQVSIPEAVEPESAAKREGGAPVYIPGRNEPAAAPEKVQVEEAKSTVEEAKPQVASTPAPWTLEDATKGLPTYAVNAIYGESLARRTNEGGSVDAPDPFMGGRWVEREVPLSAISGNPLNENLGTGAFRHRGSITHGPIVLDDKGGVIDGNNRVHEALLRGDKTILAYEFVRNGEREAAKPAAETKKPKSEEPPSGIAQLYGGAPPIPGAKVSGDKVTRFLIGELRSRGHSPADARRFLEQAAGERGAEAAEIRHHSRALRRAAKKAYGRNWLVTHGEAIDAALKDPERLAALPEGVQGVVAAMRDHIDRMSRRMIETGAATGLAADIIEKNRGRYVTRVYRAFTDPNYKDKVDPAVSNRLLSLWMSYAQPASKERMAELRSKARLKTEEGQLARNELRGRKEFAGATKDDIQHTMSAILQAAKEKGSNPWAQIAAGKLGRKDLSILRRRKSLSPELREFLGEIKSPLASYAASVSKIAQVVSLHTAYENIRDSGLGFWLFDPNDKSAHIPKTHDAEISAENNPALKPLGGLYTTPEFKKALQEAAPSETNIVFKALMRANVFIKWGKTVLAPYQFARQFWGNPLQNVRNGHGWALASPEILGKVKRSFFDLEEQKRLARLGVANESIAGEEFKNLKGAQQRTAEEEVALSTNTWSAVFQGKELAETAYQLPDEIQRRIGFYAEEKMRLEEGMRPAQAEEAAADFVRDHYPTWSRIIPLIKRIRKTGLLGSYFSFKAEQFRNFGALLVTIKKELASENPNVRARGAKRAVGVIVSKSIVPAAALAYNALNGVDKDEDEDRKKFVPPHDDESQLIWKGGSLKGTYKDVSDTDPGAMFTDPIMRVLRGDDIGTVLSDFAKEQAETFIGMSPITDLLANIAVIQALGKDLKGKAVDDLSDYIVSKVEPGFVTQVKRAMKRGYGPELLSILTGSREYDYDVEKSIGIETSLFSRRLSDNTRAMHRQAKEADKEEARKLYDVAEEERRRLFEELHEKVKAALDLGMSRKKIERILEEGLSDEVASAILRGGYVRYDEKAYQEKQK